MSHVKVWELENSPVLWVEMVYVGDTIEMKRLFGFEYTNHYFISRDQTTSFFRDIQSEKKAIKFGETKYQDIHFIKKFIKKSINAKNALSKTVNRINKSDLKKLSNKDLILLFRKFYENFSSILGIYRFSRPEFYHSTVESIEKKIASPQKNILKILHNDFSRQKIDIKTKVIATNLKKVGEERLRLHKSWMTSYKKAFPLFKEIGKRAGLTSLEVQNCTSQEIINWKLDKEIADRRVSDYKFIYQKDGYKIIIPNRQYDAIDKTLNRFTGMIASKGIAKGKVTMIKESLVGASINLMNNMPKGNILVTQMTSPDMMMAIKKASAIVTDDGGILCHAAIISREYKIPCVVGTNIATKVLKDGDLIEVDANKGVITKMTTR